MRFLSLIITLLLASPAPALERAKNYDPLLSSWPSRVIRLEKKGRFPASVELIKTEQETERKELDEKLKVGSYAIIRNSTGDWNDEVVRITARYEDGGRKVELTDGRTGLIRFENLNTLSPETNKCCKSHGVNICPNEKVYHPLPTTSIGTPLGTVRRMFENCSLVVRDGLDFIYDVRQVGKPVDCSPQKESVCVGKTVFVEAYRNGKRFAFEGPVDQVFTNGVVIIRSGLWQMPVDATTVRVQTETLYSLPDEKRDGAVVTSRDGQRKIFVPTREEIEPFDANDTQRLFDKQGLTIPRR